LYVNPFTISVPDLRARSFFEPEEWNALVESIKKEGVKVPLQVYQNSEGELILAEGEARLRAACALKLKEVPIRVIGEGTERDAALFSITTSLKGKPDWISIAHTAYELTQEGIPLEEIAKRLGKDKSEVSRIISLVKLDTVVKQSVRYGELEYRKAYEISRVPDPEIQVKLGHKAIEKRWTVAELNTVVSSILRHMKNEGVSPKEAWIRVAKKQLAWLQQEVECPICSKKQIKRDTYRLENLCSDCWEKYKPSSR